MKKLLLSAMLCIASAAAFAQALIINETCCDFTVTPICYEVAHPCLSSITYGMPIPVTCGARIPLPPDDCVAPMVRGYQVCHTSTSCSPSTTCLLVGGPDMCLSPTAIFDPCVVCGPLGLTRISLDPMTGNLTISDYTWP